MSTSSLSKSDSGFDLFEHEARILREATAALENHPEDPLVLRTTAWDLLQAYRLSSREQRQLMRAGDRQQEQLRLVSRELQEKSLLLEEQTRHLRILNTELAHEVEARKTLEVELRILATTDPLTGVYNRRRFLELGEYERQRESRNQWGFCILALDIDHFKQVNDRFGHGAGDLTLVRFVQACSACLRAMDTIGRTGGEEFAVLLPETTLAEALLVGERMRMFVADCTMNFGQDTFKVTMSVGAAQFQAGEALEALLARVDSQLYAAKGAGRNRVHPVLEPEF